MAYQVRVVQRNQNLLLKTIGKGLSVISYQGVQHQMKNAKAQPLVVNTYFGLQRFCEIGERAAAAASHAGGESA